MVFLTSVQIAITMILFGRSFNPTPDSTTKYTCLNCREKLPATSIILHLNILDLIKEGLVQPMAQKVCKWKKLEGQPQEVEIILGLLDSAMSIL